MGRYLTPLPGLLAGIIDQALKRALALDAAGGERCRPLAGRCVRLELKGLGIDLFFSGQDQTMSVSAECETQPDTTVCGTPTALLVMAVPDWRAPGSGVRIEGDLTTAQAFEKLLRTLDPDWEAAFVERFGPVIGHQLWRVLLDTRAGARRAAGKAAVRAEQFLKERTDLLVSRDEFDAFGEAVDELREAVDRLEGRWRSRNRP
ncbi:MAG: hypothetical protein HND55_05275 [Pseudomonadota bacterium]|nr:MAG: hypothetical protein HND55_05275 [Pseudomonadota bacterium]